jgi:gas vesicle protein
MNSFMKGVLVGIGIGMLIAPMRGEEMRKMLAERMGELRGYLPENVQLDQLGQYTQQVSGRVSQTASNLKGYAQQAASTMRDTASNLSSIGKGATSEVKQTGQDVADTTKRAANSATQP